MNLKKRIEGEEELVKTLAYAMAIKKGIKNKSIDYFYVFESLYGKFSDNIDSLTQRILQLQGYDRDILRNKHDAEVLSEVHSLDNDKVLVIVVCF